MRRPSTGDLGRVAGLALLALATTAAGAGGQVPGPYARVAISRHPVGTTVAVALRIPSGSRDDQDGYGGTAWLLAHTLVRQADDVLDPGKATLSVRVGRTSTLFTLLALPQSWRASWSLVDSVLFDAPIDRGDLATERTSLLDRLKFEERSPEREFDLEAAKLLTKPGDPWARPVQGTSESVGAVTETNLSLFRTQQYRRRAAALAVVGPVGSGPVPQPADTTPAKAPSGIAWTTGERTVTTQHVTSTWIAVAYPVPDSVSRTAAEMLAHLIHAQLDPTPPDPDRYSVDVRVEDVPGGPVLLVEATVFPEAAGRWEKRILDTVAGLAHQKMADELFRWRRRRFRTERLLAEAAPEAEAARLTADLLRGGQARDLDAETWTLTADSLLAAARALGEPRILRLGPDLGEAADHR